MSEIQVKEPTDNLRDLVHETGEVPVVSEAPVEAAQDEKTTGEMPVVAEAPELDERATGEVSVVSEAPVEVAQNEKATGEIPAIEVEESPILNEKATGEIPAVSEKVTTPVVKQEKTEPADALPKADPVVEKAPIPEKPVESVAASTSSNDDDAYNPSLALRIFTFFRNFFIRLFDVILTGIVIIIEAIAGLNWAGFANAIINGFAAVHNAIPHKIRLSLYAVMVVVLLGLPLTWGVRTFALSNNNPASAQTINVNQNNAAVSDNGILAPLFTPTVQYWAEDIASWTSNSNISPDLLATVMQLQSCGNASVQGGLFGIGDDEASFNDPENQAVRAIETLENALILSDGDLAMALAIYAEGDAILSTDFARWSLEARDMYILGRNIHQEAQNDSITSPDLNSWLQNTGAVLCTEAQTTRSN